MVSKTKTIEKSNDLLKYYTTIPTKIFGLANMRLCRYVEIWAHLSFVPLHCVKKGAKAIYFPALKLFLCCEQPTRVKRFESLF